MAGCGGEAIINLAAVGLQVRPVPAAASHNNICFSFSNSNASSICVQVTNSSGANNEKDMQERGNNTESSRNSSQHQKALSDVKKYKRIRFRQ
jgi:hypothetical protein